MQNKKNQQPIEHAIDILKENLEIVARVTELAELMGYKRSKLFSRHFLKQHGVRPEKILIFERLRSITQQLQRGQKSCYEIARLHSLPDEKALYNFTNRHLGVSPKLKLWMQISYKNCWKIQGEKTGSEFWD